jgi:hypothetical protein
MTMIRLRCGWLGVDERGRCYRCNMKPTSPSDECPLAVGEIPRAQLVLPGVVEPANERGTPWFEVRAAELVAAQARQVFCSVPALTELEHDGWLRHMRAFRLGVGTDQIPTDEEELAGYLARHILFGDVLPAESEAA